MNMMNDQRFFDLAMKVIARQATDTEREELDTLLAGDPALRKEFDQLEADVRLAKTTLPLVEATLASAGEFPAYARERLQTKVRQTLGRPAWETTADQKLAWAWRWASGLVAVALITLLIVLRPGEERVVIEVAMLDTTGGTRSGSSDELAALQQGWPDSTVQSFDNLGALSAWENKPFQSRNRSHAKIIYDLTTAEIRVIGRRDGEPFTKVFAVEPDLKATLEQVADFIRKEVATLR